MRPPEYAELAAYRLEKDWTWDQLAAAMGEAGVPMSPRTLTHSLRHDARPYERTLHKIRKFLAHVRATDGAALQRAGALMGGDAHV